jgi:hypothetical protein
LETLQHTNLPGALWVNIDKKLHTQVLHVDPGCGDVRDRGTGQYKPVGTIGRDGGLAAGGEHRCAPHPLRGEWAPPHVFRRSQAGSSSTVRARMLR